MKLRIATKPRVQRGLQEITASLPLSGMGFAAMGNGAELLQSRSWTEIILDSSSVMMHLDEELSFNICARASRSGSRVLISAVKPLVPGQSRPQTYPAPSIDYEKLPLPRLMQTMSVPLTHVALSVVLLTVAFALWFAGRRWYTRWLRLRQWSRAQGAEAEAPRLLERLGYDVLGAQVEGRYSLVVDGQPMNISVRADYVVARRGQTFVAEVKSGKFAPRLGTTATRRQLLEYLVAFQVDGVLLVDGETRQVHEVEFPISFRAASEPWPNKEVGWITVGLVTAAIIWMLRSR